jgi:hypothetical protein
LDELSAATAGDVSFSADQVAEAEVTLRVPELVGILISAHEHSAADTTVSAADFRQMALRARAELIQAAGLATPPEATRLERPPGVVDLDPPPWANETLTLSYTFVPAVERATLSGDELSEMAYFYAVDAMREKLLNLRVRPGVTLRDFLAARRNLKDDVVTLLSGVRLLETKEANGSVQVRVALPLARLWEIAKLGMTAEEVTQPNES